MKRHGSAVIVVVLLSLVEAASASPTIGTDLSFDIDGHRWGFWSVIDTPSHDNMSQAFREARWMNDGSVEASTQQFYSYWVIGLGPFGAVYLSRGFALILVASVAVLVAVRLRAKRRGEQVADRKPDNVVS